MYPGTSLIQDRQHHSFFIVIEDYFQALHIDYDDFDLMTDNSPNPYTAQERTPLDKIWVTISIQLFLIRKHYSTILKIQNHSMYNNFFTSSHPNLIKAVNRHAAYFMKNWGIRKLFVPYEPTQRNAFIELYLDSQEELYFKILEHMGFKNEERRFLEYPKYYPPQRSKWDD